MDALMNQLTFLLLFALVTTGCRLVYRAATPKAPKLKKRNRNSKKKKMNKLTKPVTRGEKGADSHEEAD